MSHYPVPAHGGLLARLEAGQTSRALSRLEEQTNYGLARIEQAAELQGARVQAVAYVGRQAMQAVALVSQVEQQLGQLCPLAVSRLQAVADVTTLEIVEVVGDTGRRVRR